MGVLCAALVWCRLRRVWHLPIIFSLIHPIYPSSRPNHPTWQSLPLSGGEGRGKMNEQGHVEPGQWHLCQLHFYFKVGDACLASSTNLAPEVRKHLSVDVNVVVISWTSGRKSLCCWGWEGEVLPSKGDVAGWGGGGNKNLGYMRKKMKRLRVLVVAVGGILHCLNGYLTA